MKRKLYLETFGCQMNVLDSELVLGQLHAHGYESVDERDQADVIIYNTCSVREHAEQKVWSRLGELRERKKAEPHLVIGVIGCMAEREGTGLFARHPHVDVLCGPAELDKLPALVHNACVTNASVLPLPPGEGRPLLPPLPLGEGWGEGASDSRDISNTEHPLTPTLSQGERGKKKRQVALMGSSARRSSTLSAAEDQLEMLDLSRSISPADDVAQAYVRITRGCNKFCTYCVVPYTRGPEVHRPPKNIIDEVKKLVDVGVKEVTLLGQTINHYCYEHPNSRRTTFAGLLYQIHEAVPDLPRLRFVTSFPRDFSDEALQAMRDCPRICRYLHVPAQSGSDRILKLMNRGYAAQEYYDFVARAKGFMPDICIASDFIVGFPTETDEDFAQSLEMVGRCRFKNSFIFKYSPRPGTTAIDRFADDVPEDVKRIRNNQLLAEQGRVCAENNREMVGKTVEVIVEGESKLVSRQARSGNVELGWERPGRFSDQGNTISTQLVGRTQGDQVVCFNGSLTLKGQILHVTITSAQNMTLFGSLIQEPLAVGSR